MKKDKQILLIYSSLLLLFLITACQPTRQTTRIVLLPDTQCYAEKYPQILNSQINWILENKNNIDIVLQQGDLTQNNNEKEWSLVKQAFEKLNGIVPYVLAVGNHDMGSGPGKFADTRDATFFNSFFPFKEMSQLPAFGGVFEQEKMDNAFYLFDSGGIKWMVLSLEFGPRDEVLDWANRMVMQNLDRTVIVNTHCYMYSDSTRLGPGDNWGPQTCGIGKDAVANDGEQIWHKLIRKHKNIRFVFSGHVVDGGIGTLVSINNEGLPVYQFLANYQEGVIGSENGGNGYLRIMNINRKEKVLTVKTFSPYTGTYKTEEGQNFAIKSIYLSE